MVLGLNRPINTAGRACKTRKFNRTARIVLDIKCMKSPATEQPDAVDEGRSIGAPDGGAHHQRKSQSSNSLSPLTPATLDGDRLQTLPNPNKYVDFSCPPAQPNLQCLRWPLCEPFDTDGGQLLSRGRERERERTKCGDQPDLATWEEREPEWPRLGVWINPARKKGEEVFLSVFRKKKEGSWSERRESIKKILPGWGGKRRKLLASISMTNGGGGGGIRRLQPIFNSTGQLKRGAACPSEEAAVQFNQICA